MARFDIVPARSAIHIDGRSSMHPIHSEARELAGFVELQLLDGGGIDLSSEAGGYLEVATDRLTSGNPLYDRELRRRVDSRRFPQITAELRSMEGGETAGHYRVRGDITFRGVTRNYEGEMTVSVPDPPDLPDTPEPTDPAGPLVVELKGRHIFDIRDFGLEPPRIMTVRVYPEVTASVELWAERTEPSTRRG